MTVSIIVRQPVVTTPVYDAFWKFAVERQRIFFRHLRQESPLTNDPILLRHRFTNAYRASDRVSQYLIQRVISRGDQQVEEVFFRTILFRIFNKIETWELLEAHLGSISWRSYSFERYDGVLSEAMASGNRIFSGAYIMPSRAAGLQFSRKHRNYLHLLSLMMSEDLPLRLMECRSAAQAFGLLRGYPMVGDFLGYQFLTDLCYGSLLAFSEMDFVVPGPGAKGGLRKCFLNSGGRSDGDLIRLVAESQDEEFSRRNLGFLGLWGRPLQLIDCQNLFCEIDKYSRIAFPEFTPENGRSRIKQRYVPTRSPLRLWFPPKWGINENIPRELRASI